MKRGPISPALGANTRRWLGSMATKNTKVIPNAIIQVISISSLT